ncbi:hypothetical protein [Brevundimonas sp.]|uniref:hypothetical protein n=1 Tax=Brevundimonas sp. TaxID=1871086 RepID=UPI0025CE4B9F|nr:hypothetical protein [Brevundimonas sp.]
MPHQNVHAGKATAQNSAVSSGQPNDKGREQNEAVRPEPSSYVAEDHRDASLAAPAAGEMPDYMDEGDALGEPDVQQGGNHTMRPYRTEKLQQQGSKTRAANKRIVKGQA